MVKIILICTQVQTERNLLLQANSSRNTDRISSRITSAVITGRTAHSKINQGNSSLTTKVVLDVGTIITSQPLAQPEMQSASSVKRWTTLSKSA